MVQSVPPLGFGILPGKQVVGGFEGGDISSDGGVLLLAEAERRLDVVGRMASVIADRRDGRKVRHGVTEMLGQRVFGIACGYEDCNDFDELRHDPALKVAVGQLPRSGHDLASQPTLSRSWKLANGHRT